MAFDSIPFFYFVLISVLLFTLAPKRFRLGLLVVFSFIFYSYLTLFQSIVLLAHVLLNYYGGILIFSQSIRSRRKISLTILIAINVISLLTFKYLNFLFEFISAFGFYSLNKSLLNELIIPIGISFFILQGISYLVDIYRGVSLPERNLLKFILYLSYFPKILAGPIERVGIFIPQLNSLNKPNIEEIVRSSKRILWGLFKKIIIADRLAVIINPILSSPNNHDGLTLLFASYLFAFQIYADFSGYIDIAIGISKLFGIQLSENFNNPYASKNIKEFWNRWHITLSRWFRDYLYIPLGGKYLSYFKWGISILIVFLISGLWHGANWTFIVWGLIHGSYYIIWRSFNKVKFLWELKYAIRLKFYIPGYLQIFLFFNLICLSWIFFRAHSVSEASITIGKILSVSQFVSGSDFLVYFTNVEYLMSMGLLLIFIFLDSSLFLQKYLNNILIQDKRYQDLALTDLILVSLILFSSNMGNQFIYFQF